MIHEATFESEKEKDAIDKKHSTTEEAIHVGHQMNASFILLTHFSQRYPKVPKFEDDFALSHVAIAFDFMSVSFRHFSILPKLLPHFAKIFEEISMKEEEKEVANQPLGKTSRSPSSDHSSAPSIKRSKKDHPSDPSLFINNNNQKKKQNNNTKNNAKNNTKNNTKNNKRS